MCVYGNYVPYHGCSKTSDILLISFVLQFKEIARAYEVLSNEKTRELYDEGGEEALKEGGPGGGGSGEEGLGKGEELHL